MGLGFKYHLATIVAIFFALTLGLVVGSLYVSPQVADSQKRAILSLRDSMDKDVVSQRSQVRRYQEFFSLTTPRLLREELNGATVAIIQTGDYPNATNSIRETLRLSNAQVACVVRMGKFLNRADDLIKAGLESLHENSNNSRLAKTKEGVIRQVVALLGDTTDQKSELSGILDREEIAAFERNKEVRSAPRLVIVVAGSSVEGTDRVEQLDSPLLSMLSGAGLRIVACEPENVANSDFPVYAVQGVTVPTIEKVDSDIGRCFLVFTLKDMHTANGGVNPSNP